MKQLFGSASSFLVGACCLGLTPLLGALSALGLGFLISDLILLPLLAVALSFTVWSLWRSSKSHKEMTPLYVGIAASVTAFAGLWIFIPLAYAGFVFLFAVSIWDFVISLRAH